jgi:hypothetical protein
MLPELSSFGFCIVADDTGTLATYRLNCWRMMMKSMFRSFLRSEEGFILSTEAVLIGTITVLGLIVGLAEIRNNVVQELGDYSQAVAMLSQDYAFTSVSDTNVPSNIATAGSQFSDSVDNQSANATDANGITITTASTLDAE